MEQTRDERRRAELIKLIHTKKAKMCLSDDDYRAALLAAAGKASCAEMTIRELEKASLWLAKRAPHPELVDFQSCEGQKNACMAICYEMKTIRDPHSYCSSLYKRYFRGSFITANAEDLQKLIGILAKQKKAMEKKTWKK